MGGSFRPRAGAGPTQVSHHPPVTAFHTSGKAADREYAFYGEIELRNKFWGKTAELIPVGAPPRFDRKVPVKKPNGALRAVGKSYEPHRGSEL